VIETFLLNHTTLKNILLIAISGTLIYPDVRIIQSLGVNTTITTIEGINIHAPRRVPLKDTFTGFFANPSVI
jgi:hypothetical protein